MSDLTRAILSGDLQKVRAILTRDPSRIDERDDDGVLMALLAAKTGDIALVRYVVEYSRAGMQITDDHHRGMLHYGVLSGNRAVCVYLTERVGLSPLAGDADRETPYELAARLGFSEITAYFESIVGAPLSDMYKNPVRAGFFPDPSIVRVGADYYMVNSSFVYFPCIPVSHSRDLIHWQIIGHAITDPAWCMLNGLEGGRGYWAPDIAFFDGRFYITATYRLNDTGTIYRKQIVVSSDRPEGPYSKPALIDEDGIDPSLFADDDGRRYMLLNRGARILELSADCTRQIAMAELLYYGDDKRASEGPHLLKKDGWYYLFEAEGGTGYSHRITVSRSRTLRGVYEPCPYNPIMTQQDEAAAIQRCGHGKPVDTPDGDWYMVYLCGRRLRGANGESYSLLGRETAIDPITWTPDGWPLVNALRGPSCLQVRPQIGPDAIHSVETEDGADAITSAATSAPVSTKDLYRTWLFVRAPEPDGFSLDGGVLSIRASAHDLDSIDARNVLVRRQTAFDFDATCVLNLTDALPEGADCGTVCYYDENTWVKFGLFRRSDTPQIGVVEKIGDTIREHGFTPLAEITTDLPMRALACSLRFCIETRGLARRFLCSAMPHKESTPPVAGDAAIAATTLPLREIAALNNVYYLCDEGLHKGKRFTGAMVGLYAFAGPGAIDASGKPLSASRYRAVFPSFTYRVLR